MSDIKRYRVQSFGKRGRVFESSDGPWIAATDYDATRTQIGDMNRALFALQAENAALRARLAVLEVPCECCGAHLRRVEFGRVSCVAGCSYGLAETT